MDQALCLALAELSQVIETLLGPSGCPWDREQTPESLCDYIIEECFELTEAIRGQELDEAREELGDVMFLLLFVSRLFQAKGSFTLAQSLEEAAAKMIRRHPHVFAGQQVQNQEELLRNWERIKRREKSNGQGIYDSLPRGLPPLLKAYRLNAKAARHHFTWDSNQDQAGQLNSEWLELTEAINAGDKARIEEEFGDYLFSLVEFGRRLGVKANGALEGANRKFLRRFQSMEALARARGQDVGSFKLEDWDALWREVKLGK